MDAFLKKIADSISANLLDPLTKALVDRVVPPLTAAVAEELRKQMPMLIEAVVRAVATSTGDLISRTTDRATDMIPTQLDDMIDPIVRDIMGGLFGTNEPGGQP